MDQGLNKFKGMQCHIGERGPLLTCVVILLAVGVVQKHMATFLMTAFLTANTEGVVCPMNIVIIQKISRSATNQKQPPPPAYINRHYKTL